MLCLFMKGMNVMKKFLLPSILMALLAIGGFTSIFASAERSKDTNKYQNDTIAVGVAGESKNGDEKYYLDGGVTWISQTLSVATDKQILSEGTRGLRSTAPVDFWSIDEFEAWMQTEKQKNQKLADAKDNSFYYKDSSGNYSCRAWSQADVDALYADWQNQLEKMKQGYHFTKTITTDDGGLLAGAVDPETWNANASVSLGSTVITMPDTSTVDLGQFNTSKEAEEAVKIYLETQVKNGTLTKAQSDTILKNGNFN